MNKSYFLLSVLIMGTVLLMTACVTSKQGNSGNMQSYAFTVTEPEWIRNGEAIEFEGELWYPSDGIESFTDAEVMPVHEHNNTKIFIDKVDVRPYDRLYTKFGVNKFRYFTKKKNYD